MSRFLVVCGCLSAGLMACGSEEETPSIPSNERPKFEARDDQIVGGTTTTAFPAVGTLASEEIGGSFCTATLIGKRTVLTAAHCLDGQDPSTFSFVGGPSVKKPTWTVKASGGKQHPDWDATNIVNDIALIFLEEDAPVEPLPTATSFPEDMIGQKLRFVGYGVTNGTSQTGFGTKREVEVTVREIAETQFSYSDAGKNTCNGDSGGPAFFEKGGVVEIVGVTSYGDAGCNEIGVDTRVDAFEDFISENLR